MPDVDVQRANESTSLGLFYGLAAYIYWGLQPLYFKYISTVPAAALVAHRTISCAVFIAHFHHAVAALARVLEMRLFRSGSSAC